MKALDIELKQSRYCPNFLLHMAMYKFKCLIINE